ncbi:phage tail protein [Cellulomonas aerilata]|uniref:Phage tail protein n=1 Tax=Cellulomonas aerilata TaxID=515326 RepID=A0A512D9X3_9CELL|nr:phage tail protein [Cellulomonas aerilata]GEO33284.1 phage tail protein [Cellulomonas aerilata]
MVPGLATRVPLLGRLPAVYQEEAFTQGFVAAFDDALAPVLLTLDTLHDYIDPRLCPPDFLAWVAQWLGIDVDEAWPVEQRREIVLGAALLHRRRGTLPGVADAVRLTLGLGPAGPAGPTGPADDGTVQVSDTGGTTWSASPGAPMPGDREPALTVRVTVPDPDALDLRRLDRVVDAVKPAHVPHTVVVVRGGERTDAAPRAVDAPHPEGPAQAPPGLSAPGSGS